MLGVFHTHECCKGIIFLCLNRSLSAESGSQPVLPEGDLSFFDLLLPTLQVIVYVKGETPPQHELKILGLDKCLFRLDRNSAHRPSYECILLRMCVCGSIY